MGSENPIGADNQQERLDAYLAGFVDGEGTFVTGGKLINPKVTAPGQTRADGIEGGETHQLTKGDVITVPANTPHWWKDTSKTGSVGYYAVNIEQ